MHRVVDTLAIYNRGNDKYSNIRTIQINKFKMPGMWRDV
ncbi:membrane-bound lytic murein transglycosylase MltF [Mucilaginibacter sp. UYNi724]